MFLLSPSVPGSIAMSTANRKGRDKYPRRFSRLDHWVFKSEAYRALSLKARCLYTELLLFYNGSNNGSIYMSVRHAAKRLNVTKDTASKAFRELEEKGFIKVSERSSFDYKKGKATSWILTEHSVLGRTATKEFARWKQKAGPKN